MATTGIVHYHVHANERQAFHIDPAGVVGQLVSPELAKTQVQITDLRKAVSQVSFANDGIGIAQHSTRATIGTGNEWQAQYEQEIAEFLSRQVGALQVVVFDHTVREDNPNIEVHALQSGPD